LGVEGAYGGMIFDYFSSYRNIFKASRGKIISGKMMKLLTVTLYVLPIYRKSYRKYEKLR
jgi:hypothetical protein